jgi:hypothetical protein
MDPRQRGLFGAAWTLGLAAAAAQGGLDAIALSSATGPQGLIYSRASHAQPWFDDAGATVYPIYHVMAGLGGLSGARRLDTVSSAPGKVTALAARTKHGAVLWLANLTAEKQRVKIEGFEGPVTMHGINEGTFARAAKDPSFLTKGGTLLRNVSAVDLGPYASMRLAAG